MSVMSEILAQEKVPCAVITSSSDKKKHLTPDGIFDYILLRTQLTNVLDLNINVEFVKNEKHPWCFFEEKMRDASGSIASGGGKANVRFRFWYCSSCREHDLTLSKTKTVSSMGKPYLRRYEERELFSHGKSEQHVNKASDLDNRKRSEKNALQECLTRDFQQKCNCLAIAAFVGRHQRPLKMYSELVDFECNVQGVDLPRTSNGKLKWSSIGIGTGLIHALAATLEELQLDKIRESPFWSVGFDESTNIKRETLLLIYIRYVKNGTPTTEMCTIKKMGVSKAGIAIASTILECFDKVQIDFNKCVSFG